MISVSVSLSVSGTAHVSGTEPDVYPFTTLVTLQFTPSLTVGGILANDASRTTQIFRRILASIVGSWSVRKPGVERLLLVEQHRHLEQTGSASKWVTSRTHLPIVRLRRRHDNRVLSFSYQAYDGQCCSGRCFTELAYLTVD